MTVDVVSHRDVMEFCRRYHYTGTGGTANWRWGLWHGATLLGVVSYNWPTRSTCESVFGAEYFDKVWHMGRLVLPDAAPKNSESRLIGGSLRAISQQHDVWGVLTYAATHAGHVGYVYQATNALYTGEGGHSRYYLDTNGDQRSDYLGGRWVGSERANDLGWVAQDGGVKHRYLYILGSKTERKNRMKLLKLPILPYPKE